MSNATHQRAAKPDPLVSELMRDYGFRSEAELRSRLDEAEAWARKHKLALVGVVGEEDTGGFEAKIGSKQSEYVHRFTIGVMAAAEAAESPAQQKLLAAATALFAYSHPLLRRYVESGDCEQE